MLAGLINALRIADLRRRVLFTAVMLVLYRLGAHLPVPGVNVAALERLFRQQGSVFSFLDLFVGGAFSRFAIFALGVFPYITASIIMSLLQVVFPNLKELAQEEGEAGRRKIGMYTRYLTVVQAVRKIPVQYAKRIVGRRVYGGQSTHLPLRLIQAGVIPIIFAVSVLQFPGTIAQFVQYEPLNRIGRMILPGIGQPLGDLLYAGLIILFTFFYTAVSFDPNDVSENIKKYGGFIPGIRPGRPTSEYLTRVVERLTMVGALVLAGIAVLPIYLARGTGVLTFYLAGTSLLIVVGVALETMKQIEAYVLMRHYEGFMR